MSNQQYIDLIKTKELDILKKLQEIQSLSTDTLTTLSEQSDIINNVSNNINKTNDNMKISEKLIKKMSGFFTIIKSINPMNHINIIQTDDNKLSEIEKSTYGDDIESEISKSLDFLKQQALAQNEILTIHNKQLDEIDNNINNVNNNLNILSKNMKKL